MLFTPYTFLYLVLYLLFLFSFFISTSFYWCWVAIELLILLFIGVSYTLFYNSFSHLLVYFLVQAFSSFSILVFYLFSIPILFTLSLLLNLSLFPFHSWFISSVYSFPNFIFYMVSTLHNLPIFFIFILYPLPIHYTLLWSSILFTFLVSGFLILTTADFRLLIVLSSVGNNSWFFLSSFSGITTFLIFTFVYFISLLLLFSLLGSSSNPYEFDFHRNSSKSLSFTLAFASLSGLPPFPLFFSNIYVIYCLFSSTFLSSTLLLTTIFASSFLLIGYLSILIKTLVYSYTTLSSFVFSIK